MNVLRLLSFGVVLGTTLVPALAQDADPILKERVLKMSAKALDTDSSLTYNPYTVLVKFRPDASTAMKSMAKFPVGGATLDRFAVVPGLELLSVKVDPALAAQWLNSMPGVEYAEVDHIVQHNLVPNDPSFTSLWGLRNTGQSGGAVGADIKAVSAWDISTGSSQTVIAVIDSGVLRTHPDLAANTWVNPDEIPGNGIDDDGNGLIDDLYGWDFANNDSNPTDDNSHGTHCAGTIGAVGNNGIGLTGVAWNVKIVGLKFLGANGSGSTSNAVKAVDYCFRKKIRISNNSWGGGGYSSSLYNAIQNAQSVGHLFIAAAGNNGRDNDATPHYPSSYNLPNVISVASIDRFDARSSFSNWGLTSVDLGAPGSTIYSTILNNGYGNKSGTSMATPHVAGAAAVLLSYRPGWTWQQLRDALYQNVRLTTAMSGITTQGGVLDLSKVLNFAKNLPNNAPVVTLLTPSANASFASGATVSMSGSSVDPEHGNLASGIKWYSNLDGLLGTGAALNKVLSGGTHTLTAVSTDPDGMSSQKSVQITVAQSLPNAPGSFVAVRDSRTSAYLTWTDQSSNETRFEIEWQTRARASDWSGSTVTTVAANTTSVTITIGPGVGSRFRIRSANAAGGSAWSDWVQP